MSKFIQYTKEVFNDYSSGLHRILAEAFGTLEENDQITLGKLLDARKKEPVVKFLEAKLPNFNFKEELQKETESNAKTMEEILRRAKERAAAR